MTTSGCHITCNIHVIWQPQVVIWQPVTTSTLSYDMFFTWHIRMKQGNTEDPGVHCYHSLKQGATKHSGLPHFRQVRCEVNGNLITETTGSFQSAVGRIPLRWARFFWPVADGLHTRAPTNVFQHEVEAQGHWSPLLSDMIQQEHVRAKSQHDQGSHNDIWSGPSDMFSFRYAMLRLQQTVSQLLMCPWPRRDLHFSSWSTLSFPKLLHLWKK